MGSSAAASSTAEARSLQRVLDLVSAIGDHGRMSQRRRVLAVIGPGSGETRTDPIPEATRALAYDIGRRAIDAGFRLATGGLGGVMAAASEGAHAAEGYREGDVIGIVKSHAHGDANPFVDIVIPTGMGIARNLLLVSTADVVVAIGGGSGTLSEIALAWQLGRPIVALRGGGWAGRLAGTAVDGRREGVVLEAGTAEEAIALARDALRARTRDPGS